MCYGESSTTSRGDDVEIKQSRNGEHPTSKSRDEDIVCSHMKVCAGVLAHRLVVATLVDIKSISEIIEARVKELTERTRNESPVQTLTELFDVVNTKLFVNISLLEAIIYSAMIVDPDTNDYRLPKGEQPRGLGVTSVTIPNRSLSAALAYEGQYNTITDPRSFFEFERPSSVMDAFVMPKQTVESFKELR